MAEIPVAYCDGFELTMSAFGALMRFGAKLPVSAQGQVPTVQQVFAEHCRIGMGLSHLKVMAHILVREILRHEGTLKSVIELRDEVLQSVGIPPHEWRQFWMLPTKEPESPAKGPTVAAINSSV